MLHFLDLDCVARLKNTPAAFIHKQKKKMLSQFSFKSIEYLIINLCAN